MCPQSACIIGCIVALVAFVWFFSTVSFQMCPQMAPVRRQIFTLVAFVSSPIIKVIFAMINIHHFPQFDVSSLASYFQLIKKENFNQKHLRHLLFLAHVII